MADDFEFKSSMEHTNAENFIFEKKEFIKIVDTNGSNYPASQISFNMPSISNNDMYTSLKQSYLEIPYVITINSSIDLDAVEKQSYASALKGSFANIINSLSLQIDNNNIIIIFSYSIYNLCCSIIYTFSIIFSESNCISKTINIIF